jgi:hypothetical protein
MIYYICMCTGEYNFNWLFSFLSIILGGDSAFSVSFKSVILFSPGEKSLIKPDNWEHYKKLPDFDIAYA